MTITKTEYETIKKMEGRIVNSVQYQEISGDIYYIIIEFHDGYKVELGAETDCAGDPRMNIDEVQS